MSHATSLSSPAYTPMLTPAGVSLTLALLTLPPLSAHAVLLASHVLVSKLLYITYPMLRVASVCGMLTIGCGAALVGEVWRVAAYARRSYRRRSGPETGDGGWAWWMQDLELGGDCVARAWAAREASRTFLGFGMDALAGLVV